MLRAKETQTPPIGLDLGASSLKLLQLERSSTGLSVRAAAKQAWPAAAGMRDAESMAPALEAVVGRMLERSRFSGRRVVAALPRELLRLRTVRVAVLPPEQLEEAVRAEARRLFPFDIEEAQIQFLPVAQVRQNGQPRLEVILLIAMRREVDRIVRALDAAGLVVESLDAEPCALYRGIERFLPPGDHDAHVIMDVGVRQTQVVMGRGADMTFVKTIDIGAQHLDSALARKLDVSPAEARDLRRRLNEQGHAKDGGPESIRQAIIDATRPPLEQLGREMARFLRYHAVAFRGSPPRRVRLVGGEASDPHLVAVLDAALPLPVEPYCPLAPVHAGRMPPPEFGGPMGEWAVAMGLALKSIRGRLDSEPAIEEPADIVRPARPLKRREVAYA